MSGNTERFMIPQLSAGIFTATKSYDNSHNHKIKLAREDT
jgi:hypothetical protein